jgi:hypothetical protein
MTPEPCRRRRPPSTGLSGSQRASTRGPISGKAPLFSKALAELVVGLMPTTRRPWTETAETENQDRWSWRVA